MGDMSIDLFLRCKQKPAISDIEAVIFPLGWEACEYVPGSGRTSYLWFHHENYESIRGCWLFLDDPENDDPLGTKLVFHAYSNAGRSFEDMEAQNQVIRSLRKTFGGSIYNPESGRTSYLDNDLPRLTPAEKACGFTYINYQQNLQRASLITEESSTQSIKLKEIGHWYATLDKAILRNNATVPFLV
jgi:hypothetical protein